MIPLQDWGRPALLRRTVVDPAPPHAVSFIESAVTVIPQVFRIDSLPALAPLQEESRSFLLAEEQLPPDHTWSACQLIVSGLPHRVVTIHSSGTSGWVLVETQLLTPLSAA